MKKFIVILVSLVALQMAAQEQQQWLTNNKEALQLSKTSNKPVLVYVSNQEKSEAASLLKTDFFDTKMFKNLVSKVVLLHIDISNQQTKDVRLGIHYTKQRSAPAMALIDHNETSITAPLVQMTPKKITTFLTVINDTLD